MARFRTHSAFYADAVGVGRVRAGRTVADSQAAAQAGDVVWSGLNSTSLPQGMEPLDTLASQMKAASKFANEQLSATILGVSSIDG
jgi:hypothetical protein